MVFQSGISLAPNSMVSTTSRTEGVGGNMYSFWAMNSLRMSFCMVPAKRALGMPRFSAATMYMAQMMGAGPLMVMEVVISPNGMPSSNTSMSAREEMATPHLPNSPRAIGWSVS